MAGEVERGRRRPSRSDEEVVAEQRNAEIALLALAACIRKGRPDVMVVDSQDLFLSGHRWLVRWVIDESQDANPGKQSHPLPRPGEAQPLHSGGLLTIRHSKL